MDSGLAGKEGLIVSVKEPIEQEATFVVHLNRRGSEPWHGDVIWVSERCRQSFSSMQELFAMMDSALNAEKNE